MVHTFTTPNWVKNAVFYQIFPDRFAISNCSEKPHNLEPWNSPPTTYGFKGGDLYGIIEHLDYLQDLGITAIYLNPIFQSASNHRYHTHDYFQVDPILGGNPALRTLLDTAHQGGIRIVLDGVFNHASRGFFQFHHILETGACSPYLDWFTINGFPLNAYDGPPNYKSWVGLAALPEFNTQNPQVRKFIFDIARYWVDQGIDGWRLDVPFCIDDDGFWQEFRTVVKSANPEAYLVGEVPWEAQRWLQGDQFDAVMNYQFTQACLGFFAGKRIDRAVEKNMMGLPPTAILDAQEFAERSQSLLELYPYEASLAQLNLLDSHDMPRFTSLAGGDVCSLLLAVLFQMTYPGAPCIYYGDEVGMNGGKSNYPEASRECFNWDQSSWDRELLNYYKRLVAMRNSRPALRTGDFKILFANENLIVYLRQLGAEAFIVAINGDEVGSKLDLPVGSDIPQYQDWHNIIGSGQINLRDGRLSGAILPARSGAIFTKNASAW